jgi:hypothetical protein
MFMDATVSILLVLGLLGMLMGLTLLFYELMR